MSSEKPIDKKGKFFIVAVSAVIGWLLGIITPVITPLIKDMLLIEQSKLLHVDGVPAAPAVDLKEENGQHILYVKIAPKFTNKGFKSDHMGDCKVARVGLTKYPEKIEVIHFDQTDIGWRETKEVACEFRVTIDPRNLKKDPETLEFMAYFYGPSGNEIYPEKIRIETRLKSSVNQ